MKEVTEIKSDPLQQQQLKYEFDFGFVQKLTNYLSLRPYGEVFELLDRLRLEIAPKAEKKAE